MLAMSNDQNTSLESWAQLTQTVDDSHNKMTTTDDLDHIVAAAQQATPAIERMDVKLQEAVALGAKMFGNDAALKSIQSMTKTLLSAANDLEEKYSPELYQALVTISNAEIK